MGSSQTRCGARSRAQQHLRSSSRMVLIALLLGALVLSGCGTRTERSLPPDEPTYGGTMWQGSVMIRSENPARAQTVSERVLASELYTTLTTWDPETLEAVPQLATRWDISPDAKTFTFFLRDDVKAENGDAVTAQDVRQTLVGIASKDSGSPLREQLTSIVGFDEYANGSPTNPLPGIVVVDDRTIRIELSRPFVTLPLLFGNPAMGIVHFVNDPSGEQPPKRYTTGPFRVDGKSDAGWKLVRSYNAKTYLDGINVRFFDDVNSSYEAFVRGDVDWSPIPLSRTREAGRTYGTHLFRQSLRTSYIAMNVKSPALSDERTRTALLQGVDRTAVVAAMEAEASVLNGLVPSEVPQDAAAGCGALCARNIGAASSLLGAAFSSGAPEFHLALLADSPIGEQSRNAIVDSLHSVGANAVATPLSNEQFVSETVSPNRELLEMGWSGAYPSPGAFLDPLFKSNSPANVTGFANEEVDRLLEEAKSTLDTSNRLRTYQRVETLILKNAPVIPLAQFPVDSVAQVGIRGVHVLPTGNFDSSMVWKTNPRAAQ